MANLGEPGNEVHIYRGIPYAAPPVGALRWKPPQPAASWSGIRECTAFSDISPQFEEGEGFFPDLQLDQDFEKKQILLQPPGNTYITGFTDGTFSDQTSSGGFDAFVLKVRCT
jgi:hypothetical protein